MIREEVNVENVSRDLIFSIKNFKENKNCLGEYQLHTLDTEFQVKDFTSLLFNPILGLDNNLITQVSSLSSSNQKWLMRVAQLKKIYFSICLVKTFDSRKKTIQVSLKLINNGTGKPNDTKPVIMLQMY